MSLVLNEAKLLDIKRFDKKLGHLDSAPMLSLLKLHYSGYSFDLYNMETQRFCSLVRRNYWFRQTEQEERVRFP